MTVGCNPCNLSAAPLNSYHPRVNYYHTHSSQERNRIWSLCSWGILIKYWRVCRLPLLSYFHGHSPCNLLFQDPFIKKYRLNNCTNLKLPMAHREFPLILSVSFFGHYLSLVISSPLCDHWSSTLPFLRVATWSSCLIPPRRIGKYNLYQPDLCFSPLLAISLGSKI